MKRNCAFACVLTVGLAGSIVSAQDYGDGRNDDMFREGATISASIAGFAGGDWRTLTDGDQVQVPRSTFDNQMFVDVGEVVTGSGSGEMVEAAWWHRRIGEEDIVRLVLRTENGGEFVPFGSTSNGSEIQAYTYEMGGDGNGLDFRNWVTNVSWDELTVSYSYDGGQTVFSDPTIMDPIGNGNWDGIDDFHLGLTLPGEGVNWIQASYKVTAVPAPASALALLGAGVFAGRRRRS